MNRVFNVIKSKFGGWVNATEFAVFVSDHEFEEAVPCEAERIALLTWVGAENYVVVHNGINIVVTGCFYKEFVRFLGKDPEYQERMRNTKPTPSEIH